MKSKLVIPIKDVLNYCFCPMSYKIKKQIVGQSNFKEEYAKCIRTCIYQFLNKAGDLKNGMAYLKRCWGIQWIQEKDLNKIITTQSSVKRDTYNQKRVDGVEALFNFYNMYTDTPHYDIVTGKQFSVPIFPDNDDILLSGTWDIIQEFGEDKKIRLVQVLPESNRFNTKMSIRYNLETTLLWYAFDYLFNSKKEAQISVFDLESNKEWQTERTLEDVILLQNTVKNMIYSINHNLMLFSPDKKCYHCDVRHLCKLHMYDDTKLKQIRRSK